jgi:serine/threonine protein kinase
MWSLGIIMYMILGGKPPFLDDNQARLFGKIKKGEISFKEEYWKNVSDEGKVCA